MSSCFADSESLFDLNVPSGAYPVITRISPTTATAGDTATIFGVGFAAAASLNVVIIDGSEALGETYNLIAVPLGDEVESITFTVPVGITPGTYPIFVYVIENVSNTNITITIN